MGTRLLLYGTYQLLGWLFFIVSFPFFFVYSIVSGRHRDGLSQRLGMLPAPVFGDDGCVRIWLHASSVGEVQLARALLIELKQLFPDAHFILSVMTARGMELARKELGQDVWCIYAPLDLAGIVGRVVDTVRADLYICLETELWPTLLRRVHKSGAKIALLNGRLTQRSMSKYRLVRSFMAEVLAHFSAIGVISDDDGRRYAELGAQVEKIQVLGNAKYDLATATFSSDTAQSYRNRLHLEEDVPVFLAGSTHTGEEEMLLSVYEELLLEKQLHGLVWIIVPRHLRRLADVESLLSERGVAWQRMSDVEKSSRRHDVILVDRIGELTSLYSVADYIFCGGSLVERGGHNIMEAAIYGKPVLYGPSMKDFQDAAELLQGAGCGYMVQEANELLAAIRRFLQDDEEYRAAGIRAAEISRAQQGSARRHAMLAGKLIETLQ